MIAVVGHVLTALITTNIFDNELSHVLHASTPREVLHRGYALTAIIAFVLGYFVYYKWHSAPGKWIWIVGVLWFVERAFSAWHEPNSVLTAGPSLGTVSYQMFGPGPNIPVSLTPRANHALFERRLGLLVRRKVWLVCPEGVS